MLGWFCGVFCLRFPADAEWPVQKSDREVRGVVPPRDWFLVHLHHLVTLLRLARALFSAATAAPLLARAAVGVSLFRRALISLRVYATQQRNDDVFFFSTNGFGLVPSPFVFGDLSVVHTRGSSQTAGSLCPPLSSPAGDVAAVDEA